MLGCFFAFCHPTWSLLGITGGSAWLGWIVLTGVRRVHQISGFAYLDYHATWCRIILLFLFLSHCFFDLIKNSCYLLSMWLCRSPFIIYILINSLSIPLNRLPSSPLQADSILLLPAREINERKQTIIRELQLSFVIKSVLKTFLFCFLDSSQTGTKKRTKETPRSPLFTGVTARFARAYARRKNVLLYARCA